MANRCSGGSTGMHETIERPAVKTPRRAARDRAAGPSTATTDADRRRDAPREAKNAKATAVYEAHQSPTDIGSPLVAPDGTLRMVPNLGRTVHVVGTVTNVDVNDGPHPKNIRGELGKAMNHWYTKTVAKDPLMRATDNSHAADKRNFLTTFTNAASKGNVNRAAHRDRRPEGDVAAHQARREAPRRGPRGHRGSQSGLHVRRRLALRAGWRRPTTPTRR